MIATQSDTTVRVRSELLGDLDVSVDQVITFAHGLPGFPEGRQYGLLPTGRDGVFWLQSLDFSALSFLMIDPFHFFPSFVIDLSDEDIARLGSSEQSEILVLTIVTLGARLDESATANLRAPILFNLKARTAYQSIRSDDRFNVREPIDPSAIVGPSAS
jgi:flagellar assembly factor FliW